VYYMLETWQAALVRRCRDCTNSERDVLTRPPRGQRVKLPCWTLRTTWRLLAGQSFCTAVIHTHCNKTRFSVEIYWEHWFCTRDITVVLTSNKRCRIFCRSGFLRGPPLIFTGSWKYCKTLLFVHLTFRILHLKLDTNLHDVDVFILDIDSVTDGFNANAFFLAE